jgi:hypothetical protein
MRSYRANESSAKDLISTVWNVLDGNLEGCASVVGGFVDLLDDEEKKADLLASWKGFEIEVCAVFRRSSTFSTSPSLTMLSFPATPSIPRPRPLRHRLLLLRYRLRPGPERQALHRIQTSRSQSVGPRSDGSLVQLDVPYSRPIVDCSRKSRRTE